MIIPVAGGKGGTGKSFFTANLGIALTRLGYNVLVIDLDLGGSNLHSYLGVPNRFPGIGDYIKARSARFEELIIPTGIENLNFIPGDGQTPFMANIAYAQKLKLIRSIQKMQADYILLDLGAGSGYNTLDFFAVTRRGLMITTPDFPAIMNSMVFFKNFVLRRIERTVRRNLQAKEYLQSVFKLPMGEENIQVGKIFDDLAEISTELADKAKKECSRYQPLMIYNMVEQPDDMKAVSKIDSNLKNRLQLEVNHIGFIPYAKEAMASVRRREVFFPHYEKSPAARLIMLIAKRIVQIGQAHVENSTEIVLQDAKKYFRLNPDITR